MTRDIIMQKIIDVLEKKILLYEVTKIEPKDFIGEGGLGLNSLSFLKFLTEIEKDFDIRIEDDYWDYNMLNTLEKLASYIEAQL